MCAGSRLLLMFFLPLRCMVAEKISATALQTRSLSIITTSNQGTAKLTMKRASDKWTNTLDFSMLNSAF